MERFPRDKSKGTEQGQGCRWTLEQPGLVVFKHNLCSIKSRPTYDAQSTSKLLASLFMHFISREDTKRVLHSGSACYSWKHTSSHPLLFIAKFPSVVAALAPKLRVATIFKLTYKTGASSHLRLYSSMPAVDQRAPAKEAGIGSLVLGAVCWIIVMMCLRPKLHPTGMFQSFLARIVEICVTMTIVGAVKTGQFVVKGKSQIPKVATVTALWMAGTAASFGLYNHFILSAGGSEPHGSDI